MAQVLIRKLDDGVVAALKRRARLKGRSLEQELREILTAVAALTPAQRLTRADRIRAMTPGQISQSDSAELIREDRAAR